MGEILRKRIRQSRFEGPAHEALLNLLVAAGHIRQRVDEMCEPHHITRAQYNALRILRGAHPNGYPRGEIASRLVERAPDVTRLIDRLERQGLVERVRTPADRRLSITRITKSGLDVLERLDPRVKALYQDMATRLSPRDLEELSRLCERIYG